MKNEYDGELEIIKEEFDSERMLMLEQNNREINDIVDILFAMEQNIQERETDAKSDFQSMRDEIKNKVSSISATRSLYQYIANSFTALLK